MVCIEITARVAADGGGSENSTPQVRTELESDKRQQSAGSKSESGFACSRK